MGSVATVLHEPDVAAATAGALSTPRSAAGTAVASVPPAVHEPAVAVATADALASAPRSWYCCGERTPCCALACRRCCDRRCFDVSASQCYGRFICVGAQQFLCRCCGEYRHCGTWGCGRLCKPRCFCSSTPQHCCGYCECSRLEIKLRTAARVGSDATCTDTRASGTRGVH